MRTIRRVMTFCIFMSTLVAEAQDVGSKPDSSKAKAASFARVNGATEPGTEIGTSAEWKNVPEYLKSARAMSEIDILNGGTYNHERDLDADGVLKFKPEWKIEQEGYLVVAAILDRRWSRDINRSHEAAARRVLSHGGWTAIGELSRTKDSKDENLVVFRKWLRNQEKCDFFSEQFSRYYVLRLDEKDIKTVSEQRALSMPLHEVQELGPVPTRRQGLGRQPDGRLALALNHNSHEPTSLLNRELVRQALLIAARDELGQSTWDDSLREPISRTKKAEGKAPLELVVSTPNLSSQILVSLYQAEGEKSKLLWDDCLNFPKSRTRPEPIPIKRLVEQCEGLSHGEFVKVLAQAGWQSLLKNRVNKDTPLPKDIEASLFDLNPFTQFLLARRIHAEIHQYGDSPVRLEALARVYANLGSLTDYTWSPLCQVYKARALLYAERLKRLTKGSARGFWTRSYVFGLAGCHRQALEDMKEVEQLLKAELEKGGTTLLPAWVTVTRALCEFDRKKIKELDSDESIRPLARYSLALLEEFSRASTVRMRAARDVLETTPDNFHALDILSHDIPLDAMRSATLRSMSTTYASACRSIVKLTDAPPKLIAMCKKGAKQRNVEPGADVKEQLALLKLLDDSTSAPKDSGEPSLAGLASLLREIQFMQVMRQVQIEQTQLGVFSDETLDLLNPLVQNHPYADYLTTFRENINIPIAKLESRLLDLDKTDWAVKELPLAKVLYDIKPTPGRNAYGLDAVKKASWVYSDGALQEWHFRKNIDFGGNRDLSFTSPHSFLATVRQINDDTERGAKDTGHIPEWVNKGEKDFLGDYSIQAALYYWYRAAKREEDAIRCAKRLIVIAPEEAEPFLLMSQYYLKKEDRIRWKETLDEYLKSPEQGLEHARARFEIANWLMSENKWREAKPYAYAAAESGAEWALASAARCAQQLQDWSEAEDFLRQTAERYPGISIYNWYCLCRRIGHKHVKDAEELVRPVIEAMEQQSPQEYVPYRVTFHLLVNEKAEALDLCQKAFEQTNDPIMGMDAALIANELGKKDIRDKLLKSLQERSKTPRLVQADKVAKRGEVRLLAAQFVDHLSAGKAAKFSDEQYQKLYANAVEERRASLDLWVGRFLLVQGDRDNAIKYLRLAATSPDDSLPRTLAGAMLSDLKVEAGRIRERESE